MAGLVNYDSASTVRAARALYFETNGFGDGGYSLAWVPVKVGPAEGLFHFGHLQGKLAKEVLARHGRIASDIDSVYVLVGAGTREEQLLRDGSAARAIWPRLFWFAAILKWVPLPLLDFFYRAFAKRRYRLFGKYDVCHVPTQEERGRFLEGGQGEAVAGR